MRVNAQTKIETRKRILTVAKRQFAEQGFDVTTTRDLARAADIGVGTLFNYFPTKESIVECLVSEACSLAADEFDNSFRRGASSSSEATNSKSSGKECLSLEEDLFSQVAGVLRKLKPLRKYLHSVLDTTLSPLADRDADQDQPSLRAAHLETVSQIVSKHGRRDALSAVALQLYWTLYTGLLAYWANDRSPRQEDSLALLDQSIAMYVGWLTSQSDQDSCTSQTNE